MHKNVAQPGYIRWMNTRKSTASINTAFSIGRALVEKPRDLSSSKLVVLPTLILAYFTSFTDVIQAVIRSIHKTNKEAITNEYLFNYYIGART